jgi:hypothetical protein
MTARGDPREQMPRQDQSVDTMKEGLGAAPEGTRTPCWRRSARITER